MTKAILLAEDSEDDAIFIKRVLSLAGVQNPVFTVRNGKQAIAYLDGHGIYADRSAFPLPDVLFLDLKMTPLDGCEVLAWIKGSPNMGKLLVIVLTKLQDAKQLKLAGALGAKTVLLKPIKEQDVEMLIRRFPEYWILPQVPPDCLPNISSQQ